MNQHTDMASKQTDASKKKTFPILKWILAVLLSPLVLFLLLSILIYIPPVQRFVVSKATQIASEETGMDISIERVSLEFPLDLGIEGLRVTDGDTIADVRKAVVSVKILPLLSGTVFVGEFRIENAQVNTADFIAAAVVRGRVGLLCLKGDGLNVDLADGLVQLDEALLADADIDVQLNDSVPEDTTASETPWKVDLRKIVVEETKVTLHTPDDSMIVGAGIGKAQVETTTLNLLSGIYQVGGVTVEDGLVSLDNPFEKPVHGFDVNHLIFSNIFVIVDSVYYAENRTALNIRQFMLREEKSGLEVSQLSGSVVMDSVQLSVPQMILRMPDSYVETEVLMDLSAFDALRPGELYVRMLAQLGKQDIVRIAQLGMAFTGMEPLPKAFVTRYPEQPLTLSGSVKGNMKSLAINTFEMSLPTAFRAMVKGEVENLDSMDILKGDLSFEARTGNLTFLTTMMDQALMSDYRIPSGMEADGNVKINAGAYQANARMTEGSGHVNLQGMFNAKSMAYHAMLKVNKMNIHHFMPKDSFYLVTLGAELRGRGTDVFKPSTWLTAKADVGQLQYGDLNLNGVSASADLKDSKARVEVHSINDLLDGFIALDAALDKKNMSAKLMADITKVDLYGLHVMDAPFEVAMCAQMSADTDMDEYYRASGVVDGIKMVDTLGIYHPADIAFNALTRPDTTFAKLNSGNLQMDMRASGGYKLLMEKADVLTERMNEMMDAKRVDQEELRLLMPEMTLDVKCGDSNPVANFLKAIGYAFHDFKMNVRTSAESGINGSGHLFGLNADSILIDTIRFDVFQDTTGIKMKAQVYNGPRNPQFSFNVLADAYLLSDGAGVNLRYYDMSKRLGVLLGAEAVLQDSGVHVHLLPDNPIIGYKEFSLNKDNFVFIANDTHVDAKINMLSVDGTGLKVYSTPNIDALQDITASINHLDLEQIMSVLPYMPRMTGFINGDFHYVQTDRQMSVSADVDVSNMTYENNKIGNLQSEFVYLPQEDGAHFVDGRLMKDETEVMTVTGTYNASGAGAMDVLIGLESFPLDIANVFIPDQLAGLTGYGEGNVKLTGTPSAPIVDGEVFLDSASLYSVPYGVDLIIDNDPVRFEKSHLLLENFGVHSRNNSLLNVSGDIDFSNTENILLNLRMRARDFLLIDAKRTSKSLAYGKAYVNFFARINGNLNNIAMRGRLDVLGSTDMTYVLKDSPLSTDDQMKDLVLFTDFRDTTITVTKRPPLTGLNVDMTLNIEEGAHVSCDLNADRSNYINLEGGGSLRMRYNTADNIMLNGRYSLNNGEMMYSLPVIPLKMFTIQDGSYIEFNGNPYNPTLNIIATERVTASVAEQTGEGRSVAFDVGVKVTQTLENMGLEFTLDAPEDMTVKNELMTMGKDQRGKLAVTMLTTGMYMTDANTGNLSMNSALNSFLQGQISGIAGKALKTIDLTVGMTNTTDASGQDRTDYSFKFAKRFWNNRLSIIVGGKINSGQNNSSYTAFGDGENSLIDNVSFEYRLDNTAMRVAKLFYDKNSTDLLEGTVTEYGAGVALRRKMDKLTEIFDFRKRSNAPQGQRVNTAGQQSTAVKRDSTATAPKF